MSLSVCLSVRLSVCRTDVCPLAGRHAKSLPLSAPNLPQSIFVGIPRTIAPCHRVRRQRACGYPARFGMSLGAIERSVSSQLHDRQSGQRAKAAATVVRRGAAAMIQKVLWRRRRPYVGSKRRPACLNDNERRPSPARSPGPTDLSRTAAASIGRPSARTPAGCI
jgi:hypothetical protein